MRVAQNDQMIFGEIDVSKIVFDLKSRDDIPKILRALQALYTNIPVRTAICCKKSSLPRSAKPMVAPA